MPLLNFDWVDILQGHARRGWRRLCRGAGSKTRDCAAKRTLDAAPRRIRSEIAAPDAARGHGHGRQECPTSDYVGFPRFRTAKMFTRSNFNRASVIDVWKIKVTARKDKADTLYSISLQTLTASVCHVDHRKTGRVARLVYVCEKGWVLYQRKSAGRRSGCRGRHFITLCALGPVDI
jgi:hypothetical protein